MASFDTPLDQPTSASSTAVNDPERMDSMLFSLPRETRDEIYSFLLDYSTTQKSLKKKIRVYVNVTIPVDMEVVCKQMRDEIRSLSSSKGELEISAGPWLMLPRTDLPEALAHTYHERVRFSYLPISSAYHDRHDAPSANESDLVRRWISGLPDFLTHMKSIKVCLIAHSSIEDFYEPGESGSLLAMVPNIPQVLSTSIETAAARVRGNGSRGTLVTRCWTDLTPRRHYFPTRDAGRDTTALIIRYQDGKDHPRAPSTLWPSL